MESRPLDAIALRGLGQSPAILNELTAGAGLFLLEQPSFVCLIPGDVRDHFPFADQRTLGRWFLRGSSINYLGHSPKKGGWQFLIRPPEERREAPLDTIAFVQFEIWQGINVELEKWGTQLVWSPPEPLATCRVWGGSYPLQVIDILIKNINDPISVRKIHANDPRGEGVRQDGYEIIVKLGK